MLKSNAPAFGCVKNIHGSNNNTDEKKTGFLTVLGFQPVDGKLDSEVEYHLSRISKTRDSAFIERLGTHSLNKKTCGAHDKERTQH